MIAHMSHLGLGSLAFFFPLSFLLNIADLSLFLQQVNVEIKMMIHKHTSLHLDIPQRRIWPQICIYKSAMIKAMKENLTQALRA